jgi:hypothetical protein
MSNLTLMLGYLGDTPPLQKYDLAAKTISQYFYEASSGEIVLRPDATRIDQTRYLEAAAGSLTLHYALGALVDDAPRGTTIGLLFAKEYLKYKSALGVMFDRGFATRDDPYGDLPDFAVPRQGCAVFLGPISGLRGFGSPEYVAEAVYTAIHELGHVFNLVHNFNPSTPNFMAGSSQTLRGREFYQFTYADQLHLGLCSIDPGVAPGGMPFRDRDQSWNSFSPMTPSKALNVSMEIDIARKQVLPFEPIELDILIKAPSKGGRVVIPDEIDPGYARFFIWIKHPSGEQLLYRSPRHYCPSGKTVTLAPGETFLRDVSIFGQSGGYTFGESGQYYIWAELYISSSTKIQSNTISIEVLPRQEDWKDRSFLAEPGIARLFYYRRAEPRSSDLRKLRAYRSEHRDKDNEGAIDYTLGCIHAELAIRLQSKSSRLHHKKLAVNHLSYASDALAIGHNARRRAQNLIFDL